MTYPAGPPRMPQDCDGVASFSGGVAHRRRPAPLQRAIRLKPGPDSRCRPRHRPDYFHVETTDVDGAATLTLHGELDLGSADTLREAIRELQYHHHVIVVVDLSQLDFIDCTGVRELIMARNTQRRRGGELILKDPSRQTLRVLDLLGLSEAFQID